jgi:hypothetical protein
MSCRRHIRPAVRDGDDIGIHVSGVAVVSESAGGAPYTLLHCNAAEWQVRSSDTESHIEWTIAGLGDEVVDVIRGNCRRRWLAVAFVVGPLADRLHMGLVRGSGVVSVILQYFNQGGQILVHSSQIEL